MQRLTMKFGGTSVGSADAIAQAIELVKQAAQDHAKHVVVVVSAMSGVTNLLQEGVMCAASGNSERHHQIADKLLDQHGKAASQLLFKGSALAKSPAAEKEYSALLDEIAKF